MRRWGSLILTMILSVTGGRSHGKIYYVGNSQDTTNVTSLRGAILEANLRGGFNVIVLTSTNYQMTVQGANEDAASQGDLDIVRGCLTIIGKPKSGVTISAFDLNDRVFQVMHGARLALVNLTVTGGTGFRLDDFDGLTGEGGGAVDNAGTLALRECIVAANSAGSGDDGAGIYNKGILVMDRCVVANNVSGYGAYFGGNGGGIWNGGFSILRDCTVSSNSAGSSTLGLVDQWAGIGGSGGGIYSSGKMFLRRCSISGNSSGTGGTAGGFGFSTPLTPGMPGGPGGDGGGIHNVGVLALTSCTVSGNSAGMGGSGSEGYTDGNGGRGGNGGGLYNGGILTLNTCTLSGNSCGAGADASDNWGYGGTGGAGGSGGGVFNIGALASVSSTIANNTAGPGGAGDNAYYEGGNGGSGGSGGGVFNGATNSSPCLKNSLVALNTMVSGGAAGNPSGIVGSDGVGPDLAGDFTTQGYNLIGQADGTTGFTNAIHSDLVGSIASPIDPLLGPLQDNGGPAFTQALLPGSPAIDAGKSFGLHMDQRGHRRPFNYRSIPNASRGDGSDIGAFELDSSH